MSYIDYLVNEYCPGGVRYAALAELGTITRGKRFVKDDMLSAGVPCMHYGEIYTKYGIAASESFSYVSAEQSKSLRFAQPGAVIMASAGETIEDIGKSVAWLGAEPIVIHDACYAFSSSMDPKFVSYFFASRGFRDQIRQHVSSSKVSSISTHHVAKARIPVPPLELQREVVRVLDQFNQLEAELEVELEAELRARRGQYEWYRNSLLAFSNDVPSLALGEFGTIFGGLTGKSKADFTDGNARFASYTNVFRNSALNTSADDYVRVAPHERQRSLAYGDVIFTGSSESVAEVGMSSAVTSQLNEPMYLNSFCIGFRPHDERLLHPEYSKHLFRSDSMRAQIIKTANGVTRFNVSKARLTKIQVPVPDYAEQVRVALILNRFEELANGLSVDLPAELAARRKQYEYYRDELFTFRGAAA